MKLLQHLPYHITQTDATETLMRLPPGCIDLVITDPAYESLQKHRSVGTTTRLKSWFDIFPNSRYPEFFAQLYRVMKKNTHAYIFCDEETRDVIKPITIAAGFTFQKTIPWFKESRGTGYNYPASHEKICFLKKGKRKLNTNNHLDVLRCKSIRNGYPTEKPVPLLEILITESSQYGDIVLDPFCGSGSTGEAAMKHLRRFYGSDTSDEAIALTQQRLNKLFRQMKEYCHV